MLEITNNLLYNSNISQAWHKVIGLIEVEKISKSFNGKKILNEISFSVKSGEIVAYLGQNGAGKTTTINVLATLLKTDKGKIRINGFDINKDSKIIRSIIGYVFEDFGLYPSLNVLDNLNFIGKLYELSPRKRKERINVLIEFFELKEYKKTLVSKLSKGTKQKVSIAKALLHDPEILLLDEPTAGLDPFTTKRLLDYILFLKNEGKTVLVTTHLLNIAEMIADHVILISKGEIVFNDNLSSIKNSERVNSLEEFYFKILGD